MSRARSTHGMYAMSAKRVVRTREVVVAEDPQTRERACRRIRGEERRLRIALLEVLHDHRGLGQ